MIIYSYSFSFPLTKFYVASLWAYFPCIETNGGKKSRLIMKSWRSSFSVFWKRMLEERVSSKNCLSLWSRDSQRLNLALFLMSNKAWKLMNCIWGEKRSSAEQSFLYFCVIPGYQLQTSLLTRTDELSVQHGTGRASTKEKD